MLFAHDAAEALTDQAAPLPGFPFVRRVLSQLFRSKDENEKSISNRWSTVRIECAQAGTPNRGMPALDDSRKRRRNSSSKKVFVV